jgi:hypothetical protein
MIPEIIKRKIYYYVCKNNERILNKIIEEMARIVGIQRGICVDSFKDYCEDNYYDNKEIYKKIEKRYGKRAKYKKSLNNVISYNDHILNSYYKNMLSSGNCLKIVSKFTNIEIFKEI